MLQRVCYGDILPRIRILTIYDIYDTKAGKCLCILQGPVQSKMSKSKFSLAGRHEKAAGR